MTATHAPEGLGPSLFKMLKDGLSVAAFIALYVALDAASFIDPLHGLNITPWNPAPALGMVFLLRRGPAAPYAMVTAVLLGEWVLRGVPSSWFISVGSALILALGYLLLGALLRRILSSVTLIDDRASLFRWVITITLGTFLNSLIYLSSLRLMGLLPADGWLEGVLRFWVGDAVGMAVAMPLIWWLTTQRGRFLLRAAVLRWESLGYLLLSLATLFAVFSFSKDAGFQLFYLLFLPIVWAATRQGMAGAILSASVMQAGVIVAVLWLGYSAVTIAELQILAFAMALIGFFIGCVVDEQRRTSEELRQSLRLAAAGEMAGALAHELNQPLTALAAYASACETLLHRGEAGERLLLAIRGMLTESARTGDVVRRLRDFFRTGATRLEVLPLADIIEHALLSFRDKLAQRGITLHAGSVPGVEVQADRLQIEVVLRNLLSNAIEAVDSLPADGTHRREIVLTAELRAGGRVLVCVEDSGPGLSEQDAARLFEAYQSSKSSGMGLGLLISRAIIETHGGQLWGEIGPRGRFKFELPVHETHAT